MTNHVHLIAVPESVESLRLAIGEAHRRYSRLINFREGWRGHLFQGRFSSYPLDTRHLLMAARYIERNPIEAGLVRQPEEYPWSSARAHVLGTKDRYLDAFPTLDNHKDWASFLACPLAAREIGDLEQHERTGRPLGDSSFVEQLERETGRPLLPRKPGRKKMRDTLEMRMVSPD